MPKQLAYKWLENFKHLCRELNVLTHKAGFYKVLTQTHDEKRNHVVNFLNRETFKKFEESPIEPYRSHGQVLPTLVSLYERCHGKSPL